MFWAIVFLFLQRLVVVFIHREHVYIVNHIVNLLSASDSFFCLQHPLPERSVAGKRLFLIGLIVV